MSNWAIICVLKCSSYSLVICSMGLLKECNIIDDVVRNREQMYFESRIHNRPKQLICDENFQKKQPNLLQFAYLQTRNVAKQL